MLKINTCTDACITFTTDMPLELVNALRRIMISEVPTWCIDIAEITTNTTVLVNEMIAHRLGLMALTYPLGGDYSDVIFTLDYKAESTKDVYVITSNDLVCSNPQVKMLFDSVPLVKVNKGQALKLKAKVFKGTGSIHSKWSPVTACFFKETDDGYFVTVETTGTMKARDVVMKAFELLLNKLSNVTYKQVQ